MGTTLGAPVGRDACQQDVMPAKLAASRIWCAEQGLHNIRGLEFVPNNPSSKSSDAAGKCFGSA